MSNTTRNDVKQIAATIESLAKQFQANLESGGDILGTANELARNSQTFVFTLGEFYALQQAGSTKTVTGTAVSNPSGTPRYHNVRDSRGRFTRK
jgi:hypothetical protein